MKKLLAVLVILGLVAVPFRGKLLGGGKFGVAPEHPLGDVETVEEFLMSRDFQRTRGELDYSGYDGEVPKEIAGATMWHFKDRGGSRQYGGYFGVDIVVDATGKIRAIGGRFYSGHEDTTLQRSKSEYFLQTIWREATGDVPIFARTTEGEGMTARHLLVSSHARDGLRGYWKKVYESGTEKSSISDQVLLFTDP